MMITLYKLNAAARMVESGETEIYAAGLYCVPLTVLHNHIRSLFAPSVTQMPEIKGYAYDALFIDDLAKQELAKAGNELLHGVSATKGHLTTSGGIRGHSAGDIFPYVIVIVGNHTRGFKYHLTGKGLYLNDRVFLDWKGAEDYAKFMLAE